MQARSRSLITTPVMANQVPCYSMPMRLVGSLSAVLPLRKFGGRARTTGNRQMQGSCWRRRSELNR
jgi:hypothetical protein